MPIIKACEIHFPKLNPKRPSARYNKKNPTWEVQIRTTSVQTKKQWELAGIKVKAVIDEESGTVQYYRANLRKRSIKSDGEPAGPVKVVNGRMDDVDPDTIGNGSIANIRLFQYEYEKDGKKEKANVLMALQLTKHVKYTPSHDDDFEMEDYEEVEEDEELVPGGQPAPGAADDGY